MEKRILAVAVAGALAAPAIAFAQSTVQIYGRVTYEWGRADQGPDRPNLDFADTPGGSAIGFKGVEQLGGGLSAWFQCESSADITGFDTSSICTRNSAVGFRGGFGNVFAGKWDTPMKRAMGLGTVGAEETGILGMSFLAFGGSGGGDISGVGVDAQQRQRWKRRESNIMQYETPKFGGFQVMGAVTAANRTSTANDNVDENNQKARLWSIAATYANGPLGIGLAYERHNDVGYGGTTGAGPAITGDLDDRAWGAAIGYRFGPVRLGATYLDTKYETGPGQELKKKTWAVGIDWMVAGPHTISAYYSRAGDSKGNSDRGISGNGGAAPSGGDTGGDAWSLAYQYAFSKRTTLKLGYVRVDNDSNTNSYRIGNTAGLLGNGENVDGWALLVKHNF
jgi:predicted porin